MPQNYWLMKSEPDCFSIDDLAKMPDKTTIWDGVRNYQARNIMKDQMQKGDLVFFYHSNAKPAPHIAGIAQIVTEKAIPDPTQFDPKSQYYDEKSSAQNPRWMTVRVKLIKKFSQPIYLDQIKNNPKLQKMTLTQKGSRLSVQPVKKNEWDEILEIKPLVHSLSLPES